MSDIPFVDAAWPVVTGCSPKGAGCLNCYAARLAATRLKHQKNYKGLAEYRDGRGHWVARPRFNAKELEKPLRWRKPRRVFVAHTGDLLHKEIRPRVIYKTFAVMLLAQQHTFMVFTKRWQRAHDLLAHPTIAFNVYKSAVDIAGHDDLPFSWPLPNVYIVFSASTQDEVDKAAPLLRDTPAAKRGLSLEPLLERVNVKPYLRQQCGHPCNEYLDYQSCACTERGGYKAISFIITGGETSLRRDLARPCPEDAPRLLLKQCRDAGVAFWWKQWGNHVPEGQEKYLLGGVRYEELP